MHAKTIISCSLPHAWQEAVEFVRKSKQEIIFGGGKEVKHAVDSQVQIILDNHAIEDALNHIVHPSDPFCSDKDGKVSENKIMAYVKEYENDFDASKFSYTYYGELTKGFPKKCEYNSSTKGIGDIDKEPDRENIDLIKKLRDGLKFQIEAIYYENGTEKHGLPSNRNIITLFNNEKWDMMSSSPCWNILWIRLERIDEDGTIWVSVSTWYRSHDLTDAWESNFIAQVTMVVNKILKPLSPKIKILEWHESNASLHIYKHNLPIAEKIKKISVNPMLINLQKKYDSI